MFSPPTTGQYSPNLEHARAEAVPPLVQHDVRTGVAHAIAERQRQLFEQDLGQLRAALRGSRLRPALDRVRGEQAVHAPSHLQERRVPYRAGRRGSGTGGREAHVVGRCS